MGHKVNPVSLRIGLNRDFPFSYYSKENYANLFFKNYSIHEFFQTRSRMIGWHLAQSLHEYSYKQAHHSIFVQKYKKTIVRKQKIKESFVKRSSLDAVSIQQSSLCTIENIPKNYLLSHICLYNLLSKYGCTVIHRNIVLRSKKGKQSSAQSQNFVENSTNFDSNYSINPFDMNYETITSIEPKLKSVDRLVRSSMYENNLNKAERFCFETQNSLFHTIQPLILQKTISASFIGELIKHLFERTREKHGRIFDYIINRVKKYDSVQGIRITCSGRINGIEMAKTVTKKYGPTPTHVFSKKIDYSQSKAFTKYGVIGIKIWICYR